MYVVISPAKKLDETPRDMGALGTPYFAQEVEQLLSIAQGLSADDLQKLMHISPALAKLNAERFAGFADAPRKAALFCFAGDTYQGLDAGSLDADALRWAQDHLGILSGLYGLLRPMDALAPYRLEMGSRLANPRGKNLYDFWGDKIARRLQDICNQAGAKALVNCASQEYFGAVDLAAVDLPVITPQFYELKNGAPKIVSFYAKRARGAMARFVMENRLSDPVDLLGFTTGGYAYAPDLSTPEKPAFLRADAAS